MKIACFTHAVNVHLTMGHLWEGTMYVISCTGDDHMDLMFGSKIRPCDSHTYIPSLRDHAPLIMRELQDLTPIYE